MIKFDEKKLAKRVKPYLLKGRPGDYYHALLIVKWIKRIGRGRKDLPILITAGYVHDTGWYKVLPAKMKNVNLDTMLSYEKKANKNSAKMINIILKPMGFAPADITKINRLVRAADKHWAKQTDEQIVVDADTLCKLDRKRLAQPFRNPEWSRLIAMLERDFAKVVKTRIGKEMFPKLLAKLKIEVGI